MMVNPGSEGGGMAGGTGTVAGALTYQQPYQPIPEPPPPIERRTEDVSIALPLDMPILIDASRPVGSGTGTVSPCSTCVFGSNAVTAMPSYAERVAGNTAGTASPVQAGFPWWIAVAILGLIFISRQGD